MNEDFAASVIRATQGHPDLSPIVHDALARALKEASTPAARRKVLEEVERSIDDTMFPPHSLHLVEAMLRELREIRESLQGGPAS
jgi:hypothetical protein